MVHMLPTAQNLANLEFKRQCQNFFNSHKRDIINVNYWKDRLLANLNLSVSLENVILIQGFWRIMGSTSLIEILYTFLDVFAQPINNISQY